MYSLRELYNKNVEKSTFTAFFCNSSASVFLHQFYFFKNYFFETALPDFRIHVKRTWALKSDPLYIQLIYIFCSTCMPSLSRMLQLASTSFISVITAKLQLSLIYTGSFIILLSIWFFISASEHAATLQYPLNTKQHFLFSKGIPPSCQIIWDFSSSVCI